VIPRGPGLVGRLAVTDPQEALVAREAGMSPNNAQLVLSHMRVPDKEYSDCYVLGCRCSTGGRRSPSKSPMNSTRSGRHSPNAPPASRWCSTPGSSTWAKADRGTSPGMHRVEVAMADSMPSSWRSASASSASSRMWPACPTGTTTACINPRVARWNAMAARRLGEPRHGGRGAARAGQPGGGSPLLRAVAGASAAAGSPRAGEGLLQQLKHEESR
jgi:hypothetical protein